MRAGDGTYTVRPGSTLISQTLRRVIQFNRYSDDNITEIRIALEVTAVRDAAKNATDKQIAELEAILDRMKQYKDNTDTEKRTQIDCEFHRYIAECSGNMLLAVLINSIMDMIKEYIRIRLEQNPQGNELGIIWHQKIVDAIKNHDVDTAGSYMRDHIDASFHQLDIDPA